MAKDTLRPVLDELARRLDHAVQRSEEVTDAGATDIARALHIPTDEVENALETLVDEQLVTCHALGRYTLTFAGLQKSRRRP